MQIAQQNIEKGRDEMDAPFFDVVINAERC